MDNEMIERCKAELERCFAPAVNFKAPYAKVMSHMAIKAIIKALRDPTEKMKIAGSIDPGSGGPDDGYETEIWQAMLDYIIGDE